jgi:hypothetical protein
MVELHALDVCAAVASKLSLDPIDGGAVSVGSFAAVAELGEAFDGGLVALKVETLNQTLRGWKRLMQ